MKKKLFSFMALMLALSLFSCSENAGIIDDSDKVDDTVDFPPLPACVGENQFKGREFLFAGDGLTKFYRFDEEQNLVYNGFIENIYDINSVYEYSYNEEKKLFYLRLKQLVTLDEKYNTFEDEKKELESDFENLLIDEKKDKLGLIWKLETADVEYNKDASYEELVEIAKKNKEKILDHDLQTIILWFSDITIYTYEFSDDNKELILRCYFPENYTSLNELHELGLFDYLSASNSDNEVKIYLWSDWCEVDGCYYDYAEITEDTIKGKLSSDSKPSKFGDEIEIKYVIEDAGEGYETKIVLNFEGEETPVYIMSDDIIEVYYDNTENSTFGQPPKEKGSDK